MTTEKIITKAIQEMKLAEASYRQAAELCSRAIQRLEGIYSPAAPKRKIGLTPDQIAQVLGKRIKNMKKSRN